MNPKLLEILQHALGLDQYGRGESYRSHFCTGPGCTSYEQCRELVAFGYMKDHGPQALADGMSYFIVTDAGREAVRIHSPEPPKLTRSQQRYRRYLNDSGFMTFREWLRHEKNLPQSVSA